MCKPGVLLAECFFSGFFGSTAWTALPAFLTCQPSGAWGLGMKRLTLKANGINNRVGFI